jgi:hypothetical protein
VPKRHERVAPPPTRSGWDFRYATNDAANGWEKLCSAAPANARAAWDDITADPKQRNARQHPLRGDLAKRQVGHKLLDQWQYEVTGAGRVWYCIDPDARTVWLTLAVSGHPRRTE